MDKHDNYFLWTVTVATETSYDSEVCTGRVKFKTVVLKHFYISLLESTEHPLFMEEEVKSFIKEKGLTFDLLATCAEVQ